MSLYNHIWDSAFSLPGLSHYHQNHEAALQIRIISDSTEDQCPSTNYNHPSMEGDYYMIACIVTYYVHQLYAMKKQENRKTWSNPHLDPRE